MATSRGMIRKRGSAYEVRVFVGVDAVGNKQYRSETVRGTERDAKRRCTALLAEVDAGKILPAGRESVAAFLEEWFAHASLAFEGRTTLVTRSIIDDYLVPGLGEFPLHRLRTQDIDTHFARLATSGGVRAGGLSVATVRRAHGVLRRALNQGVRWGRIPSNPAENVSLPSVKPASIRPPSQADVLRVIELASFDDPDMALLLAFLAQTGARRGEALGLRWQDIDWDDRSVTIQNAVSLTHRGLELKSTKTHQSRSVAMDETLVERLRVHREWCASRARRCDVTLTNESFVFAANVEGTSPRRPDSVTRAFRRLCVKAGVPASRLHDLRHFAATELLSAAVDVRTVSGRLGHRNAATTLNVYSHFVPQRDREAAAVLRSILPVERVAALDPRFSQTD